MQIMVVDDSKAMRMIVIRTLRLAGFRDHTFLEAGDGEEAFAAITANPPDLVLSDWNMPKLSGIDLLKKIRAAGCKVKFGFVTSESTREMRMLSNVEGALFLIAKPFNQDTFREALDPFID
ncbi:response regulator [Nitrosovibrio sp. Nv6]|uniref:response regulator n=1 Tax=Nitrosovibrio sp. Nv6 TaxID=1855340 RepID=UPI0008AC3FA2|nr:response regulator [Nitrosovibrio sp. Nv6]SEO50028.1 two-component system, chemotaxis family, response regulator CheY [Nitrosovibrio sp. Nv6]